MKPNVENAKRFLECNHVAVAGASRTGNSVGNGIAKKLLGAGYEVYLVNPNASVIDGRECFPTVNAIPGEVDGVVIATHARNSAQVVRDAHSRGITQLWFHKGIGAGSFSEEALSECKRLGIDPIVGGCPMMFVQPVDVFHKCLKFFTT